MNLITNNIIVEFDKIHFKIKLDFINYQIFYNIDAMVDDQTWRQFPDYNDNLFGNLLYRSY